MGLGRIFAVACFLLGNPVWLRGEIKPWQEARSPHFRVITNGSARSGVHVAREFELIRALFATQFPGYELDSPAPLLILAPRDEDTARMLLPDAWRAVGNQVAGLYRHGQEKQYALIRLDAVGSDLWNKNPYGVVYHEYVHSLLHRNLHWIPLWLDEGIAEFYQYTRFEGDRMYLGAPPKNTGLTDFLNTHSTLPIEEFIEKHRSVSADSTDTSMFYAHAWALTHFLVFGPGMGQGEKLKHFFNDLQKGKPQKAAFVETFGSFEQMDKDFQRYLLRFTFTSAELPSPTGLEEKSFESRTMTQAETEAELAGFEIWSRKWELARGWAEAAAEHDPKLGLAQEDLGYVFLNEGQADKASQCFAKAVDLDGKLYLAQFAKTMLMPEAQPGVTDRAKVKEELLKITASKADFAAAYVQMAKIYVEQGDLSKGLTMSMKAEQLAPFLSGYHILSGEILRRMGDPTDAAIYARYVAERWNGSDHDEAVELLERVPANYRPPTIASENTEANIHRVEGTVQETACQGTAFSITLDSGGKTRTFKGTRVQTGFADTLWYGDHFTRCFYLKGLRAVVQYREGAETKEGDLVRVGFRDDLREHPTAENRAMVK
jgi:tetratricopeptide (TPR) repeat protein